MKPLLPCFPSPPTLPPHHRCICCHFLFHLSGKVSHYLCERVLTSDVLHKPLSCWCSLYLLQDVHYVCILCWNTNHKWMSCPLFIVHFTPKSDFFLRSPIFLNRVAFLRVAFPCVLGCWSIICTVLLDSFLVFMFWLHCFFYYSKFYICYIQMQLMSFKMISISIIMFQQS